MTSIPYLQGCPKDQITIESIRDLVSQELPEGLSLEYKEKYSAGVIETIAAFANTHGGLIIVGVKDDPGPDRIVGVPETELVKISNSCIEYLDPPFTPEIISLRIPGEEAKFLLLIRVYPERSTRPVAVRGKIWIRLHGNNDGADSYRLRHLFSESVIPSCALNSKLSTPTESDWGPLPDLFIRSGVVLPVELNSSGRPLSEKKVRELINFLNASPLSARLTSHVSQLGISGLHPFRKEGFNRARNVRLSWQGIYQNNRAEIHPVECVITLNSTTNGIQAATTMEVTVDFILRQSAFFTAQDPIQFPPSNVYRIPIVDVYEDLASIIRTVIDPEFKEILADIAGVEINQVPRPMSSEILLLRGAGQTLSLIHISEPTRPY